MVATRRTYKVSNGDGESSVSDVASIVSEMVNYEGRISGLEQAVRGVRGDVTDIKNAINAMANKATEASKTPWASLAAWAAVLVTFGALAMSGFVRDLNRIESTQNLALAQLITNATRDGESHANRMHIEDELAAHQAQFNNIDTLFDSARKWASDHDRRVVELNTRQTEQIDQLERRLSKP